MVKFIKNDVVFDLEKYSEMLLERRRLLLILEAVDKLDDDEGNEGNEKDKEDKEGEGGGSKGDKVEKDDEDVSFFLDSLKSVGKKIGSYLLKKLFNAFRYYTVPGLIFGTILKKMDEMGLLNKDVAELVERYIKKYMKEEFLVKIMKDLNDAKIVLGDDRKKGELSINNSLDLKKILRASPLLNEIYKAFYDLQEKVSKGQSDILKVNYKGNMYDISNIPLTWVVEEFNKYLEKNKKDFDYNLYYKISDEVSRSGYVLGDVLKGVDLMKVVGRLYKLSDTFKVFYRKNKDKKKVIFDFITFLRSSSKKSVSGGSGNVNKERVLKKIGNYLRSRQNNFFYGYINYCYDVFIKNKIVNIIKGSKEVLDIFSELERVRSYDKITDYGDRYGDVVRGVVKRFYLLNISKRIVDYFDRFVDIFKVEGDEISGEDRKKMIDFVIMLFVIYKVLDEDLSL